MSFSHVFDIASTGMSAQSVRLNVIASNLSNKDSIASDSGKTYRAKEPIFEAIMNDKMDGMGEGLTGGVKIASIEENQSPLRRELRPGHPLADEDGYVTLPNVDPIQEMANMISASRSYQDNVQIFQTAKTMYMRTINSMSEVR